MNHFRYHDGRLYAEGVCLTELAENIGTPFFCYSSASIEDNYNAFSHAISSLDADICYAVKANSNKAVLSTLSRLGVGADVVSAGEIERVLSAGILAKKIVFSGVGKTFDELCKALLYGVRRINIESFEEIEILSKAAEATGCMAEVAVRVNPDVDAKTHDKISTGRQEDKFGIDFELAKEAYALLREKHALKITGVAVHIGSQLIDLNPFRRAYSRLSDFAIQLRSAGYEITELDLGGGLGIAYNNELVPTLEEYAAVVSETVGNLGCKLVFEPGRRIVGNSGVLVTKVIFIKEGSARRFCVVDSAMNDLIRPTLYNAYHQIISVREPNKSAISSRMDVVGPICESGDFFARDRALPPMAAGDLMAVLTAGAYGAVMGSTYNSRSLAPEVMVNGDKFALVRKRFTVEDMMNLESIPTWLEKESKRPVE